MNISEQALQSLQTIVGEDNIRRDEPMKEHTTMKVGGPADWFITPADAEEIAAVIRVLRQEQIPYYILGNGSNVICKDTGYRGAIICLLDHFSGYEIRSVQGEEVQVAVRAGMLNKDFSEAMIREGLAGFEFASGIPGSVGGATAMNAGAYDGEIRQIVRTVTLLDRDLQIVTRTNEEMDFGYRHSLVSSGDAIVLETVFGLKPDNPEKIRARVEELSAKRLAKQPLEYPSCGSTFKRPEGYFAGKLISDAGLKGCRYGGAQVSEKHAGFVINRDQATAADVLGLIEHIKKQVKDSQGVMLECEVKILE